MRRSRPPHRARLAACVLAITASSALLAADAVSLQVRHAVGGVHRIGGYVPVAVVLENTSGDDLRVRLEAGGEDRLSVRDVDLASGVKKAFTFYIGRSDYERSHDIKLETRRGRELARATVTSVPVSRDTAVVGIVGDHPLGWGAVGGDKTVRLRRVHLEPGELPGRAEGLRALDIIVWPDPQQHELTPEQVQAIAHWTEEGGQLVLAFRERWLESSTGGFESWTGVRAEELVPTRALVSLREFAPDRPLENFDEALSAVRLAGDAGEVWLRETWGPVAVFESRGRGGVTVLGFLPSDHAGWPGWKAFWRALVARAGFDFPDETRQGNRRLLDLSSIAQNNLTGETAHSGIDVPSFGVLVIAFLLFLVAIGPGEYLVLKFKDRLAWTWVTYPLLVAAFATGTYLVAMAGRSGASTLGHVMIRDLLPLSDSFADELHLAFFVTGQGEFRLGAREPGWLVGPAVEDSAGAYGRGFPGVFEPGGAVHHQGPAAIEANLPKWTFLGGSFLGHHPAKGARVEADLFLLDSTLSGWIEPRLGTNLEDSWVIANVDGRPLLFHTGPIQQGEKRFGEVGGKEMSWEDVGEAAINAEFSPYLILQTARRAVLRGVDVDKLESSRRSRRLPDARIDPHPHHDWSGLLERDGAVLIGRAADPTDRGEVEGAGVPDRGVLYYRIPLTADEVRR